MPTPWPQSAIGRLALWARRSFADDPGAPRRSFPRSEHSLDGAVRCYEDRELVPWRKAAIILRFPAIQCPTIASEIPPSGLSIDKCRANRQATRLFWGPIWTIVS